MWRNYLTVGIRALLKSRAYAFINIFGLALGLAACLIILLYVRYELGYDKWIPGADRAYQVQNFYHASPTGGEAMALQLTSYISRTAMVKDFPEIESSVFVFGSEAIVLRNGEPSFVENFAGVDGNLFQILRMPFAAGDPAHALDRPGDLVLTESEARRWFPNMSPLGKTLTLASAGRTADYRITGVLRDPPPNTHRRLGMVVRIDPQSTFAAFPQMLTSWGTQLGAVYVRLRPGVSADAINSRLPAWEKRNIPDDPIRGNAGTYQDWRLTNIRDIHLGEAQGAASTPGNDRATVLTFAFIALLILGTAVVNFVNLATARASQRAREVALRKVVGASRRQLIVQFTTESILLTALAMLLGLAMAELALPHVNAFLDSGMAISYWGSDGLLLPIVALILMVGVGGGLYPAFHLSRFQPGAVLKANHSAAETYGSGRLRNLLVVGQFAISTGLIICTAIIYAQTVYARTADAGYRRDGLLQVERIGQADVQPKIETLIREIERVPGVRHAAPTQIGINPTMNMTSQYLVAGMALPLDIGTYSVGPRFFDAMGMRFMAGRGFDMHSGSDQPSLSPLATQQSIQALAARGANAVITEGAARKLGFANPQAAIGKQVRQVTSVGSGAAQAMIPLSIIGVVADARFRSVRQPVQPIIYLAGRADFSLTQLVVRYQAPDPGRVMADIEQVWRRLIPTVPFTAAFAEDRLRQQYSSEEARAQMFGAFALLAVVIGCLGLFGLAAFTAERRTREIGIRKVLGARTRDIVRLLAWQFSKPVIIANLIAWPVAWWLMRDWLDGFDSRISLSPAFFLGAALVALVIAVGTIAGHAFRVARASPIQALRYE